MTTIYVKLRNSGVPIQLSIDTTKELAPSGAEGIPYKATFQGKDIFVKELKTPVDMEKLARQVVVEEYFVTRLDSCASDTGLACFKGIVVPEGSLKVTGDLFYTYRPLVLNPTPTIYLMYDLLVGKELFNILSKNLHCQKKYIS